MARVKRPRGRRPPLDAEQLRGARAALRRANLRRPGRSCAPISRASSASAAGTGARDPTWRRSPSRFAELGYIDDAAYALAKSRALSARGYGKRRLDRQAARRRGRASGRTGRARRMPTRKRSTRRCASPSGGGSARSRAAAADPQRREKAIAAMVRAGHGFALAEAIIGLPPGSEIDLDELRERSRLTTLTKVGLPTLAAMLMRRVMVRTRSASWPRGTLGP